MVRCGLARATPSPGLRAAVHDAVTAADVPRWLAEALREVGLVSGLAVLRHAIGSCESAYRRRLREAP